MYISFVIPNKDTQTYFIEEPDAFKNSHGEYTIITKDFPVDNELQTIINKKESK